MKKQDFIRDLQENIQIETGKKPTLTETRVLLDCFIATMTENLSKGKSVRFRGFGRFEFRKRLGFKRRTYIRSGRKVPGGFTTEVDDHVIAYFTPSNSLNHLLTKRLKPILFEEEED